MSDPIIDLKTTVDEWKEDVTYWGGHLVRHKDEVYEAKWWTLGDEPSGPHRHNWETPWQLYKGMPILKEEADFPMEPVVHEPCEPQNKMAAPLWNLDEVYVSGQRVQYDGQLYEASWWTQGDVPSETGKYPWDTPWHPVTTPIMK